MAQNSFGPRALFGKLSSGQKAANLGFEQSLKNSKIVSLGPGDPKPALKSGSEYALRKHNWWLEFFSMANWPKFLRNESTFQETEFWTKGSQLGF